MDHISRDVKNHETLQNNKNQYYFYIIQKLKTYKLFIQNNMA